MMIDERLEELIDVVDYLRDNLFSNKSLNTPQVTTVEADFKKAIFSAIDRIRWLLENPGSMGSREKNHLYELLETLEDDLNDLEI